MIRDITIDLGAGNPGAVGINADDAQRRGIRRVTVQDAVGAGRSSNNADRLTRGSPRNGRVRAEPPEPYHGQG